METQEYLFHTLLWQKLTLGIINLKLQCLYIDYKDLLRLFIVSNLDIQYLQDL